ncbi:hypothetical protein LCGC14_0147390 [marine sediment metagenome]|uniref:Uncharacterized protein n=1 Tax=marine sediment metagenome TaxID=412755 RepID=A0A0F9VFQ9_9ZZZZ
MSNWDKFAECLMKTAESSNKPLTLSTPRTFKTPVYIEAAPSGADISPPKKVNKVLKDVGLSAGVAAGATGIGRAILKTKKSVRPVTIKLPKMGKVTIPGEYLAAAAAGSLYGAKSLVVTDKNPSS